MSEMSVGLFKCMKCFPKLCQCKCHYTGVTPDQETCKTLIGIGAHKYPKCEKCEQRVVK